MKNWTKIKNKKGLVIWRDDKTGLLWSPPTKDEYTWDQVMDFNSEDFSKEFGKFKNRIWAVPSREEIYTALAHGLSDLEPKFNVWSRSASVYSVSRSFAWVFYSVNGYVFNNDRTITFAVRCVGRWGVNII